MASSSSGSRRSRSRAIVVFLIIGTLYVVGLWFGTGPHLANLTAHGGFAPRGLLPILTGAVAATGFYFGAEIVTVASAESAEPAEAVARATHVGDQPRAALLRRLDRADRGDRPVELAGHQVALRRRARHHRRTGGRPHHERGGADGGALGAQLGALRLVADAAVADPSRRCAAVPGAGQQAGHAGAGDPGRHGGRLHRGDDVLHLARRGVSVPGEVERHGGALRLPADRALRAEIEAQAGARQSRSGWCCGCGCSPG